jgi:hypothetical protein
METRVLLEPKLTLGWLFKHESIKRVQLSIEFYQGSTHSDNIIDIRATTHIKMSRIQQLTESNPMAIKNIAGAMGASKGSPLVPR